MPDQVVTPELDALKKLPIINRAIEDLSSRLPENLHYHSLEHTLNVMESVYKLAVADSLPPRHGELLVIAAAYHDWGYIESSKNNEPIGARKAIFEMMKSGGYSLAEMVAVGRAIMSTAIEKNEDGVMVQNPRMRFGQYLCDADLSGFGKPGFFNDSLNVLGEIFKEEISSVEDLNRNKQKVLPFLNSTLAMMRAHNYQTPAACLAFNQQKKVNIGRLDELIKALNGTEQPKINEAFNLLINKAKE